MITKLDNVAFAVVNGALIFGKVSLDDTPTDSPRHWSNLSDLCYLKDSHGGFGGGDFKFDDSNGIGKNMDETIKMILKQRELTAKNALVLPVYKYTHSDVSFSLTPFNCPFDSGLNMFAVVPYKRIYKEYGVKKVSAKLLEKIEKVVAGELDDLEKWINGYVYQWSIYSIEPMKGMDFGVMADDEIVAYAERNKCYGEFIDGVCGYYDEKQCFDDMLNNFENSAIESVA